MKELRVLICDGDSAYIDALSAYMLREKTPVAVSTFTKTEAFLEDEASYDTALLGQAFMEELKTERGMRRAEHMKRILYLCGDVTSSYEPYETIYKFQEMNAFMGQVLASAGRENKDGNGDWIGIFSPIRHELQLPFALLLCRLKAERERVLFLDLEENSILPDLIGESEAKSVLDYLYLLENGDGSAEELYKMTGMYEGISYFAPMRHLSDFWEITPKLWKRFFASLAAQDLGQVVVLFDGSMCGMEELFTYCGKLLLLSRPGDYYALLTAGMKSYLSTVTNAPPAQVVKLPLSAANLTEDSIRIEQLVAGNLGRFVRRYAAA